MANDEKIQSSGRFRGQSLEMGDATLLPDFILILLNDFQVCLGVNWLCILGPITWDFQTITMDFIING